MLTLILLLIPLIASILVLFLKGESVKWFSFFATIIQLIFTFYVYSVFQNKEAAKSVLAINIEWISSPKINFNIALDGMSLLMVFLSNLLMPLIVLAGFL